MCSLFDNDRLQLDYKDYERSIGDRAIPNDATIKTLEPLGATINFIYIYLTSSVNIFMKQFKPYINKIKSGT